VIGHSNILSNGVFFYFSDLENLGKKKKKKPAVNPDEIASEDEKVNKNFASAKF
jgi:hypothetical protein